jgi:hypothetical protein
MEPWLLPKDAFSRMRNAFLRRGVIEKRLGYSLFSRFPHFVDDEAIGSSGSANYSGTLSNYPVRDAEFTDGTQTIEVDSSGNVTGDGTGTCDNDTGDYDITFTSTTTGSVTCDYNYFPGNPIVGIENYYTNAGTSDLMVFDTKRCGKFNETTDVIDDVSQADVWTGGQQSFIWAENWQDRMFVTNNLDRPKSYNGTSFTDLMMDIDNDASNEVTAVLMFFLYKERLVALSTTEDGTTFKQRARWCKAGDPDEWYEGDGGGYVDCPTLDWIVSADFIGDDLVVFFERSVWRLKYTGNADLPFRWEQVAGTDGSYSTFATFAFSDEVATIGASTIVATDGLDAYSIDDKIPDFVLDIDQAIFNNTFSIVIEELKHVRTAYPTIGATENDETLCLDYDENSWSIFDYGFNCMGYYQESNELTLDDVDDAMDDIERAFDDRTNQVGFPTTLSGDVDGYLWQLDKTGSDNGNPIELDIISGRWNPFVKKGLKAWLGWVDFLVDRDPNISFDVQFFNDHKGTAHTTKTITCDSETDDNTKVWKRAYCGCVGESHRVRIYHSAANQTLKIHAIKPWFKAGGGII